VLLPCYRSREVIGFEESVGSCHVDTKRVFVLASLVLKFSTQLFQAVTVRTRNEVNCLFYPHFMTFSILDIDYCAVETTVLNN
jgi:hypothetical protein